MGYAKNGLQSGFTMVSPQFVPLNATGKIALEEIKPVGDAVDTDGGIVIETLTAGGQADEMYMWIDWGDPKGWCDDTFTLVSGVSFDPGQGLWIQGTGTGASIRTSGKVGTNDVVVALRSGFTATGNPYPTSVNLQDLIPEGENIDTEGGIVIETLTAGGQADEMYMWIDWGDPKGWCDDTFTLVSGVSFEPGQGLWIQGTKPTEYIRFPAPEL